MFTPFEKINSNSRIWIYQSNRLLSDPEIEKIREKGQQFIEQWTAHNMNLLGSFEISNSLFLIIAVDESVNDASGCSIDKSFSFIKQMEKEFNIQLLNRSAIAFEKNGSIEIRELSDFLKLVKEGYISNNDIIFNNLVTTKAQIGSGWKIPVKESWVMKMIQGHPG